MVFKLLVVTLVLLVLDSSAQRSANLLPPNRWYVYNKYDFIKNLASKREPDDPPLQTESNLCIFETSPDCVIPNTVTTSATIGKDKRARERIDLMTLLRVLSPVSDPEIFLQDQLENKPNK